MRRNLVRTIKSLVLVSVLMPAGMLFATETHMPLAVTSSTANWYDVEQASNVLNRMQNLSLKVRREVARVQVQGWQTNWRAQAQGLSEAKNNINTIGDDLMQLDHVKNKLEPWQRSLIHKVTPQVHEMVYQTDAALNYLSAHENRIQLALSEYPQNINIIYKNANQMAGTIGTVTQYARAEERMAELEHNTGKVSS